MKVLFLDIDGVCNSQASFKQRTEPDPIDKHMARRVRQIVQDTGCVVVLSSSWRCYADLRAKVKQRVCEFIDVTPDKRGLTDRGCEVIAWLENHPEVTAHAILDDNSDFHEEQPLFKTDWLTGLTKEIADAVTLHLNAIDRQA